jgi:hypothetical protein
MVPVQLNNNKAKRAAVKSPIKTTVAEGDRRPEEAASTTA